MSYIDFVAICYFPSNFNFISYEIKVSRNDFLKDLKMFDEKQRDALKLSTQFFYICPEGLIQKHEVPDRAGLCWVKKTVEGYKIVTVKPAIRSIIREIPILNFLGFIALLPSHTVYNKSMDVQMEEQDAA